MSIKDIAVNVIHIFEEWRRTEHIRICGTDNPNAGGFELRCAADERMRPIFADVEALQDVAVTFEADGERFRAGNGVTYFPDSWQQQGVDRFREVNINPPGVPVTMCVDIVMRREVK